MNANAAFAVEVLVWVYKLLPREGVLEGVLTDYEGIISQIGDTVIIHRNVASNLRYIIDIGVRQRKPDICLTIDKSFSIERKDSAMNTANAIVGGILYLTPPPWKAFAATVKYDEDTDTVTCLYGVKYKKKREKKELKEKLERAERKCAEFQEIICKSIETLADGLQ